MVHGGLDGRWVLGVTNNGERDANAKELERSKEDERSRKGED